LMLLLGVHIPTPVTRLLTDAAQIVLNNDSRDPIQQPFMLPWQLPSPIPDISPALLTPSIADTHAALPFTPTRQEM
ncbi:hydrogenase 4 subunit F, partial [Yersinia enterocolitica]|nr:hydrogenase 4 subunit F [Yersinia enterocolitica]